jgi:hypothetical protein
VFSAIQKTADPSWAISRRSGLTLTWAAKAGGSGLTTSASPVRAAMFSTAASDDHVHFRVSVGAFSPQYASLRDWRT